MSSDDEQTELCQKCEGRMDSLTNTWAVELVCNHKICLKCVIGDYPQETDEIIC